jgi:hypothetical protein
MNIFFMYKMFLRPELAGYDYYIRCDTDALPTSIIPVNFWEFMLEGQLDFISTDRLLEVDGCYDGLHDTAIEYGYKHHNNLMTRDRLSFLDFMGNRSSFCGHFNVGNLHFFRSSQYLKFAKYIVMDQMGLYTNRWSDQILYPQAMALFSSSDRLFRFGWLEGYCHIHHDAPVVHPDTVSYDLPYNQYLLE